jgi:hypothetical protein
MEECVPYIICTWIFKVALVPLVEVEHEVVPVLQVHPAPALAPPPPALASPPPAPAPRTPPLSLPGTMPCALPRPDPARQNIFCSSKKISQKELYL